MPKFYRSPQDIIYEVLIMFGRFHTKSVFYGRCGLSFQQAKRYEKIMVDNKLIIMKDDEYFVSQKGLEYISRYESLVELTPRI